MLVAAIMAALSRNIFAGSTDTLPLGVLFALIGAVLMAAGLQYQSRGVNKMQRITGAEGSGSVSVRQTKRLLARPSWLLGTGALALAVLMQLAALAFAPLIVVQPLGVLSLVIVTFLNSKINSLKLDRKVYGGVAASFVGIVVFVVIAASHAVDSPINNAELSLLLAIFGAVLLSFVIAVLLSRKKPKQLLYVTASGCFYGFVVTLTKTVISRLQHGQLDPLTWISLLLMVAGFLLAMMYVQSAHSSGPPDLVVAGLTVIDPLVAVTIGILILGETASAPLWIYPVFVAAGVFAIWGVVRLARYHPESRTSMTP